MRSSSSRLEWISHGLYLENAENTHSEGSHNKIAKVDSEGEKEVSENVVDRLVCDDRMWTTVAGRGSRHGLVVGRRRCYCLGGRELLCETRLARLVRLGIGHRLPRTVKLCDRDCRTLQVDSD